MRFFSATMTLEPIEGPQQDSRKMNESADYLSIPWRTKDRFLIEAEMVRRGGYIMSGGVKYGCGKYHHFKAAMTALWPHFDWHIWSDLLIKTFAENQEVGIMGPGSSGKTYTSAAFGLCTFYIYPTGTSIIMSSTTREGLQLRIWGSIKELHNKAKARREWLPGRVIESRFILTSSDQDAEAQDFRDGIIGVACKVGGTFVGLSNYVGLKNDRVMLIADEASLMSRGFLDSVANLRKNPEFKLIAMGNPKDRNDALGVVCEPHSTMGGWEGIEYLEQTRTWRTRAPGGVAVQLCGYDTPNAKFPKGTNPYRGIITPEQIQADLDYYGRDSLQFSMMNLGLLPRDGGTRRVVTMSLCEQNQAFDEIAWQGADKITRIIGIDAAYSGIGGDRCVMTDLQYGPDATGRIVLAFAEAPIVIPVTAVKAQQAEEQIAEYVLLYCKQRNIPPEQVGFDSTGRGTLMSAFARLWSPQVVPIEFGGRPTDRPVRKGDPKTEREAYGKMVTALWYSSRLLIESKQLRKLPREVAEEGSMREWGIARTGLIDVEPKHKTKERMGRSPDLWDSFVVALEMARRTGFEIAGGQGVGIVKRQTPKWLTRLSDKRRTMETEHSLTYS
jgi:hypothetical protein